MAADRMPPGPPPRDPTAPARLLDAAGEVGLRVERAQRHLDLLQGTLDRLADVTGVVPPPPGPPPGGAGAPTDRESWLEGGGAEPPLGA